MSTEDLLLDISLQKEFVDAGIVPPILHWSFESTDDGGALTIVVYND